jgi:hypothetical protein
MFNGMWFEQRNNVPLRNDAILTSRLYAYIYKIFVPLIFVCDCLGAESQVIFFTEVLDFFSGVTMANVIITVRTSVTDIAHYIIGM